MPTKLKEREAGDKDAESPRPKEKRHHHKSKGSSRKPKKENTSAEDMMDLSPTSKRRASVPETKSDRATPSDSPSISKSSLPYPAFSKAHSKEAVGSRDDVRISYHTPDPTDLEKGTKRNVAEEHRRSAPVALPSPPETTLEDEARFEKEKIERERAKPERKKRDLQKTAEELKKKLLIKSNSTSEVRSRRPKPKEDGDVEKEEGTSTPGSARSSKPSTPSKSRPKPPTAEEVASSTGMRKTSSVQSRSSVTKSESIAESTDSDATSIAPAQPTTQRPATGQASRESKADQGDEPPVTPRAVPERRQTPAYSISSSSRMNSFDGSPMPPPPPPAPDFTAPRVDYLLRNGGLPHEVPRSMSELGQPKRSNGTKTAVATFFSPYADALDQYMKVISRNGSLAVATGYRSIARRLLDRLENVFARDISSQVCECTICQTSAGLDTDRDERGGVSWGEILEYVSGRQVLPQWPPFFFDNIGLGIANAENAAPMQKLDIDVPEEFRAHYIRQSKKTKQAVDSWLESQPSNPSPMPQDFDDETLTFAMLTRIEADQRHAFKSLLGVPPSRPASAASSSAILAPDSDLLPITGFAIQRLYRLPSLPRHPETAMYLLTNPHLHDVLATLAAISDQEWEILTSGRFDGFLRSGADDIPHQRPETAPPSLQPTTPHNPNTSSPSLSRTLSSHSPSHGAPVALDEETEIAALAEIEREIFLCMESLEDAFELLHQKAETVRSALRERGAGLAQASQRRRTDSNNSNGGPGSSVLDARMGTPASLMTREGTPSVFGGGDGLGGEAESDWGDGMSEIAPDDSASNVSRARVRRPKRRTERRTPAPVEEEEEEGLGPDREGVAGEEKATGGGGTSWLGSKLGRRKG